MSYREFESFAGIAAYYDELMCGVPYDYWVDHVERLFELRQRAPHRILDLACGTGNVSEILASRGYEVVGADLSADMIAAARAKSASSGFGVEYLVQDAAELDLPGPPFDACISLFDSLNYITDPVRLRSAICRVHAHLRPGGVFIFDVNSTYALRHGFFTQNNLESDDRLRYVWRSEFDEATRLCQVSMRFFMEGREGVDEEFRETHVQRAYEEEHVREMLGAAGFADVQSYHSYTTKPVRPSTDRIFFVGERL